MKKHSRSLTRRAYLNVRRKARAGGRILAAGALTGLGTYAGLRAAAPILRGAARGFQASPRIRRLMPTLAASTRRLSKPGSALDWAIPTAALTVASKTWDEAKTSSRRRYRRWLRSSR